MFEFMLFYIFTLPTHFFFVVATMLTATLILVGPILQHHKDTQLGKTSNYSTAAREIYFNLLSGCIIKLAGFLR